MPQLLFAGFPEGALPLSSTLSILKKEGRDWLVAGQKEAASLPHVRESIS